MYTLGWLVFWKINEMRLFQVTQFWFLSQAIMCFSFYLLGRLLSLSGNLIESLSVPTAISGFLTSTAIMGYSFNLNHGPFPNIPQQVVIVSAGVYGNPLLFPISALTGSAATIFFARAIGSWPLLRDLGNNSLIPMGLNGLFFHFINIFLVAYGIKLITTPTNGSIFVLCVLLSSISLLACIPFIELFRKYVPQLVGKTSIKGPFLPNLIK
jgi:acyltransferase